MSRRSLRKQKSVAWLALVAILLLSIVPTISQVVASPASHAGHASHAAATQDSNPHHHSEDPATPCPDGDRHRDDWHKCGYCDFLVHAPALDSVPYLAQFSAVLPPADLTGPSQQRVRLTHSLAAQPRGPPNLLA